MLLITSTFSAYFFITEQKHVDSTESTVEHYTKVAEGLQIKIATQESLVDELRRNVDALNIELEENRQNLDQQTAVNVQDKVRGVCCALKPFAS